MDALLVGYVAKFECDAVKWHWPSCQCANVIVKMRKCHVWTRLMRRHGWQMLQFGPNSCFGSTQQCTKAMPVKLINKQRTWTDKRETWTPLSPIWQIKIKARILALTQYRKPVRTKFGLHCHSQTEKELIDDGHKIDWKPIHNIELYIDRLFPIETNDVRATEPLSLDGKVNTIEAILRSSKGQMIIPNVTIRNVLQNDALCCVAALCGLRVCVPRNRATRETNYLLLLNAMNDLKNNKNFQLKIV